MPSLGELTFDLALNAAGFASKLAEAGRAVSSFAVSSTKNIAVSRDAVVKHGVAISGYKLQSDEAQKASAQLADAIERQEGIFNRTNRAVTSYNRMIDSTRTSAARISGEMDKQKEVRGRYRVIADKAQVYADKSKEKSESYGVLAKRYEGERKLAHELVVLVQRRIDTLERMRSVIETIRTTVNGEVATLQANIATAERALKTAQTTHEALLKKNRPEGDTLPEKERKRLLRAALAEQKSAEAAVKAYQVQLSEKEKAYQRHVDEIAEIDRRAERLRKDRRVEEKRRDGLAVLEEQALTKQLEHHDRGLIARRVFFHAQPEITKRDAEIAKSQDALAALSRAEAQYTGQLKAHQVVLDRSKEQLTELSTRAQHVGQAYQQAKQGVQDATAAMQAQGAIPAPTLMQKQADRLHTSLKQLGQVTGVVATGWTELYKRVNLVSEGRPLSAINESLGPLERKLERASRGFRGVSDEVKKAQEHLYTMQDRLEKVQARHTTLEVEYRRHLQTVTNAKRAAAHNDFMIEQEKAKIETEKAKRERELERASLTTSAKKRNVHLANAEESLKAIARMESTILSIRESQRKHNLTAEENTKHAEEYATKTKIAADAIQRQNTLLDEARQKLSELKQADKENEGSTRGVVGAIKAKAQALQEAQEPMSTSIRSWLQGIGVQTDLQKSNEKTATSFARLGDETQQSQRGGWLSWLGSSRTKTEELNRSTETHIATLHRTRQAWGNFAEFLRITVIETLARTSAQFASNLFTAPQQLVQAGYQQVKDFEGVTFSINALMAKEYRATEDSAIGFVEAMEVVEGRTQKLLAKFEKAAIESNFTSQELASSFGALMQTFSSKESETILSAITDWGNVMQKKGYELEGVAFVLGQVQNAGKLQTQDWKQLQATYGMNVLDYLGKALDKTESELMEMMSAGTLLAQDVIPIIVEGLEKDFGGAGEAAGNTFQGLSSSIVDLSQIALRKFFTPAAEAMKPPLQFIVATLQNPLFIEALERIGVAFGETITNGLNILASTMPDVSSMFDVMVDNIGASLGIVLGLTDQMWEWGGLVFDAFLEGMMEKVGGVADIAGWIGEELAYWMQPHSPPKMAPDIDKWGEQTAQTYFDAMSNASAETPLKQFSGIFEGDQSGSIDPGSSGRPAAPAEDTRSIAEKLTEELAAISGVEGVSGTNGILTYIAKLVAQIVENTTRVERSSPSSRRTKGAPDRKPGESSEEYRLRIEEMLASGSGRDDDSKKEYDQEFKAGIRLLKAEGKYDVALVRYQEALEGMQEGSKEYLDTMTEIVNLEKIIAREQEKAERGSGGGRATKTDAQREAEKAEKDRKAAEDAQVKWLIKTKEYTRAQEILEARLGRVQKGTKEYFDTLTKLEDLKAKIAKEEVAEGTESGGGSRSLVREDTGEEDGDAQKEEIRSRFDTMKNQTLARIHVGMSEFRKKIKEMFAPVIEFYEENFEVIKKVLATIGLKLGLYFFKTRAIPFFRELAHVIGLGANAMGKWITPMNMLSVVSTLMMVAWIKNIGGFRDVTNNLIKEVTPNLERLQRLVLGLFDTFKSDGIPGIVEAITAQLPVIINEIQVIATTATSRLGDWMKPTFAKIQEQLEESFDHMIVWLRGKGLDPVADILENMLAKVRERVSKPEFGLFIATAITGTVGVFLLSKFYTLGGLMITKLTEGAIAIGPYILNTIKNYFPLIIGAAIAAIVAYGPQLQVALNSWGVNFWDWVQNSLPVMVAWIARSVVVITGAFLSASIELVRVIGVVVADGIGKLLPLVPKALDIIRTFILDSALWIVAAGVPQLAYAALQMVTAFIQSVADNLPAFTFGLGEFFGKVFWGIAGVVASGFTAILAHLYFRFLPLLVNDLAPALRDLGIGMVKGVAAGFIGVIYGLFLRPVVNVFRKLNLIAWMSDFFRDIGYDAGAEMIDGFVAQLPPWIQALLVFGEAFIETFDSIMVPLKRFLGILNDNRTETELLVDSIYETRKSMHALQPSVLGVSGAFAVLSVGSYLMFFRNATAAAVTHGSVLQTKIIPMVLGWAAALQAKLFPMIGINTVAVETFNGVVMKTYYTGVAGAIRSTYLWIVANAKLAFSMMKTVGAAVITLGKIYWTQGIPGVAAYIKAQLVAIKTQIAAAFSTTALAGHLRLMGMAYIEGGVAGAMLYVKSLFAVNAATSALIKVMAIKMAVLGAVALSVGGVIYAWQRMNQQWDNGMKRVLENNKAWQSAQLILEKYADSSDIVQEAHRDMAQAVKDSQENIKRETKNLADMMLERKRLWWTGFAPTQEMIDEQNRVLQQANKDAERLARELEDAIYQRSAKTYIAETTVRGYADAVRDIGVAVPTTVEQMKDLNEQFQDTITKGFDAINALVDVERAFNDDREQEEEAHQQRLTELLSDATEERRRIQENANGLFRDRKKVYDEIEESLAETARLEAELAKEKDAERRAALEEQIASELQRREELNQRAIDLTAQHQDALTQLETDAHLKRVEEEKKAHQEREIARALAYVREREQAKQRLGQVFMEQLEQRKAMLLADRDLSAAQRLEIIARASALRSQLQKEYGVQAEMSEDTYTAMSSVIDNFTNESGENISDIAAKHREEMLLLQEKKDMYEEFEEQVVTEIMTEYDGKGEEELRAALDKVPERVEVLVQTRLNDPSGILSGKPEVKVNVVPNRSNPSSWTPTQTNTTGWQQPPRRPVSPRPNVEARAKGGPVRPFNFYEVVEQGPELLRMAGRTFLMMGSQSGEVIPTTAFNAIGQNMSQLTAPLQSIAQQGRREHTFNDARGSGVNISMPITISGNTVRDESDIDRIREEVTENIIGVLNRVVLKGVV